MENINIKSNGMFLTSNGQFAHASAEIAYETYCEELKVYYGYSTLNTQADMNRKAHIESLAASVWMATRNNQECPEVIKFVRVKPIQIAK